MGRSGPLYLVGVATVTGASYWVPMVAEKRSHRRGPVGVDSGYKPSMTLDFSPGYKWLTADRGAAPHMRKAAFVSKLPRVRCAASWWVLGSFGPPRRVIGPALTARRGRP